MIFLKLFIIFFMKDTKVYIGPQESYFFRNPLPFIRKKSALPQKSKALCLVFKQSNLSWKKNQSFNKINKQPRTFKKFQGRNGTPCGCLMFSTTWHEDLWERHMLAYIFPPWACEEWWQGDMNKPNTNPSMALWIQN